MANVRLSIILPTYNCENSIDVCLQSIIRQVFEDYEIIIKDGGSTDGTLEKINDLQRIYPSIPIYVTSGPDKGIYDAMNKAVAMASGSWLYFLGSDDRLFDEHVLSGVFSLIDRSCPDMVYGNVSRIHSGEIYLGKFDFEKLLIHNICHQSIFLTTSSFLKYGPFDIRYTACADWDLNIKLFKKRIKIKFTDIIVAYYNENGFSNVFRDSLFFEKLDTERVIFFSKWPNKLASYGKRAFKKAARMFNAGVNET